MNIIRTEDELARYLNTDVGIYAIMMLPADLFPNAPKPENLQLLIERARNAAKENL